MSDITFLSAVAMAEQVRSKKISPLELVQAHLERIERFNPIINAYIQVDPERARREARLATEARTRGEIGGLLYGVPISIKNSIEVAGFKNEVGSRLRSGVVATKDATLVSRLRAAGAIILGVTNTPEFLMAWETDNLLYGRTNNPWDITRTAGGSSGGEAAAIASGCSAAGVGSDGGGSIRVPAHFCGICGLKPTPGRIPATGHFPNSVGPFALLGVVGPMARTVADVQALFEIMAGADDGDPCAAPVPVRKVSGDELKHIRIGYFEDDGRTPITAATRGVVHTAAQALQRAGFQIVPFRPQGLEAARQLWWKFFGIAGGMLLAPMTKGHEAELSAILKEFSARVARGPAHTGESLLETWVQRDVVRTEFLAQTRDTPILLCPAAAIPAFKHGERSWMVDGGRVNYLDAWSYTEWFNLLGNPAAVVPVGQSGEGLPIGVQVVGRPWEEELVLAVASVVEQECGGFQPPLRQEGFVKRQSGG
ncbi:MAG TPA: amidase [Terriglobales bacterium]|nr:amidase [Terriglobales bacterium]